MPNYRETPVSATKWRRSHQVTISNPLDHPEESSITFHEQDVIVEGTDVIFTNAGGVSANFSPVGSFNLLNPVDNSVIGTMTHQELYIALYSLYMQTATARDAT
jgi:hypothetical protein